jgi:hypothetical protein
MFKRLLLFACFNHTIHNNQFSYYRFSTEQSVSSTSQVKNSVQRSVRSQLVEQYPTLEPIIDEIMPKKLMIIARWYIYFLHKSIYICNFPLIARIIFN